jgi:peroxiredoxin
VLASLAVVIALVGWTDPGPGTLTWFGTLTAFEGVALFGGAAVFAALVAQSHTLRTLSQQHRLVMDKLDALDSGQTRTPGPAGSRAAGRSIGSRAPDFALPDVDGKIVTLDALREAGRPVVLIFSDPNCGPCDALLPQIADWQSSQAHAFTLALLSRGTAEANRPKIAEHNVRRVLIQEDREVADAYGVWGTPSAVMIRPDGTIGTMLSQAETQIHELIASLVTTAPARTAVTPIPPAALHPEPAPPPPPAPAPSAPASPAPAPPAPPTAASRDGLTVQMLNGGVRPVSITNVPLDMKLKQESCVQTEPLPDGGAVLYNGCNRQVLTLNATAALVWECCDSEHEVRAMVAEVMEVFPAAAEAERDVRQVVQMLADAGMVSRAASVDAAPSALAES